MIDLDPYDGPFFSGVQKVIQPAKRPFGVGIDPRMPRVAPAQRFKSDAKGTAGSLLLAHRKGGGGIIWAAQGNIVGRAPLQDTTCTQCPGLLALWGHAAQVVHFFVLTSVVYHRKGIYIHTYIHISIYIHIYVSQCTHMNSELMVIAAM